DQGQAERAERAEAGDRDQPPLRLARSFAPVEQEPVVEVGAAELPGRRFQFVATEETLLVPDGMADGDIAGIDEAPARIRLEAVCGRPQAGSAERLRTTDEQKLLVRLEWWGSGGLEGADELVPDVDALATESLAHDGMRQRVAYEDVRVVEGGETTHRRPGVITSRQKLSSHP